MVIVIKPQPHNFDEQTTLSLVKRQRKQIPHLTWACTEFTSPTEVIKMNDSAGAHQFRIRDYSIYIEIVEHILQKHYHSKEPYHIRKDEWKEIDTTSNEENREAFLYRTVPDVYIFSYLSHMPSVFYRGCAIHLCSSSRYESKQKSNPFLKIKTTNSKIMDVFHFHNQWQSEHWYELTIQINLLEDITRP